MCAVKRKNQSPLMGRIIRVLVALSFISSLSLPASVVRAQSVIPLGLNLPAPGTMLSLSEAYTPTMITGITMAYDKPFDFDFIVTPGDDSISSRETLREESERLIKYFLAALTVPEKELWVNLSPLEEDKIIPDNLGQTDMGKDMLAQDYLLKQLASSLIYPEEGLGKEFWARVYDKAYKMYGTTEIPMNTFNKVWIVPDKAVIYEHTRAPEETESGSYERNVFVLNSHLKIMMENDYYAMQANRSNERLSLNSLDSKEAAAINSMTADIFKDLILPEIEKEINEGRTFANLRQMFNSLILSAWYKQNLKETIIGQVYAERNKISGIELEQGSVSRKIYDQYMAAIEKGVFDYIKEVYDPNADEVMPRQYFSGGIEADIQTLTKARSIDDFGPKEDAAIARMRNAYHVRATFAAEGHDLRDLFLRLWHESGVDYVEAEELTAEASTDEMINYDYDFLSFLESEGEDYYGAYYLLMTYQALLDRGLPAPSAEEMNAVGLDPDEEQWERPAIFLGRIKDPRILDKLGITDVEHASDRGLHVTETKKIYHALNAFAGVPHFMVIGQEMVRDAYVAYKRAHPVDGDEPELADLIDSVAIRYDQALREMETKVEGEKAKAVIRAARERGLARVFVESLQLSEKNLAAYGQGHRNPLLLTKMKLSGEDRDYADVINKDHSPDFVDEGLGGSANAADFGGGMRDAKLSDEVQPGGIDFNAGLLNMDLRRDENGVSIPVPQSPVFNMEFNGLVPIIINVAPVSDLPLMLGIKEEEMEEIRQYSYAA